MRALRALLTDDDGDDADFIHASGFNATVEDAGGNAWTSADRFGLDQGMIVLMIENYRSGLPWRLFRDMACTRTGLRRAGFRGGWL